MADEARLSELLLDWQNKFAGGSDVSAAELCHACPELADELGRRIAVVRHVGALAAATAGHPDTISFAPLAGDSPLDSERSSDTGPVAAPAVDGAPAWLRALGPPEGPGELARIGQFAVRQVIGTGGMGVVVRADDLALHRPVAIKVLWPHLAADAAARERFVREARAVARLDHERIVPVHHVGEAGGQPYLVMPLLCGETLKERLARDPRPPLPDVLRLGREIAEGLTAAHAAGVVHRDIKPANVWLKSPHGSAVLLDFGLARVAAAPGLTHSQAVQGTPQYMAPEQANGQTVDHRADLFSLGVVLYELTTGTRPFDGSSMLPVLSQVVAHDPSPPREVRPDVPAALSDLVVQLLAKNPADRPATAGAVVGAIRAAEGHPAPETAPTLPPRSPPAPPSRPRRRGAWVAAAAAAIGLAALLAVWPKTAAESVRVVRLDVRHTADVQGRGEDRGVIGTDSFGTTVGDQVTIEAILSRPAYAYLVAFKTDGVVELCFPLDDAQPPPLTDRPHYPPPDKRGDRFELSEGPGLQAFALLASPTPLPPWRTWKESAGTPPWARVPTDVGTVWQYDGQWVMTATPRGPVRGDRGVGAKAKDGSGPVVAVTDWLRRSGGASTTAAAIAFGVVARP